MKFPNEKMDGFHEFETALLIRQTNVHFQNEFHLSKEKLEKTIRLLINGEYKTVLQIFTGASKEITTGDFNLQLSNLITGVSALSLFIQSNWLGPLIDDITPQVLSQSLTNLLFNTVIGPTS
jgi:hypothetical protein